MSFKSLGSFLDFLETEKNDLVRVDLPVPTDLDITEIHRRTLHASGPALLFKKPIKKSGCASNIPLLTNLFGTHARIAHGIIRDGKPCQTLADLRQLGCVLAALRQPKPPRHMRDILRLWSMAKMAASMRPKHVRSGPIDEIVIDKENDIDLCDLFPVQVCWPGEPAPLITWPLVVTRWEDMLNVGVYRMQCLGGNRTLMRWLAHRGGAHHHALWKRLHPNEPFPVAIMIGCDPATLLACVAPVPEALSEYHFSGLLRGKRLELTSCSHDVQLQVAANAEIVLEGFILPTCQAPEQDEGPYGDHTGYYNCVERFPVFECTKVRMRSNPIYLSTYTGRPPDEPSILGEALGEIFVPLLQQQFPEISDFYLPPEGCSYRIAIVSIRKAYPGHAKRVMMGVWSFLRQFIYTKWIIVVDDDINPRDWKDVMWAVSTRADPVRDLTLVENTPIDYLDFASPHDGLGGKVGLDATNKVDPETRRTWGKKLDMDSETIKRVDAIWADLNLFRL